MQQSTKLKAIEYIFTSNKEKELSYSKKHNLIVDDKIVRKYIYLLKDKYKWLDSLEWIVFFNFLENVKGYVYYFYLYLKPNLYKDNKFAKRFWNIVDEWTILKTKFDILDSKIFLNSILEFIDNEKENLAVYKAQEQIKELNEKIDKSKGKFERFKLPLTYNFSNYLSSYTQYYKTLKLLENQYSIEDIQIYQWKITFILSENKDKEALIEFDWKEIFIDKKSIYFKEMKTWNTTKDLFVLAFSYFKENNVNNVDFDSLERYYKNNIEKYKSLKTTKFYDEWVRWYIKEKNKKIELDKFIEVTTNWLACQYYHPER